MASGASVALARRSDRRARAGKAGVQVIEVVELYTDGGTIQRNPSPIGGTWAWCGVGADGRRLVERGGFAVEPGGTNNHMEQLAIIEDLEAMNEGWEGLVRSDSQVALGRVFLGWKTRNLPQAIAHRSKAALARLGKVRYELLQGHPTRKDLEAGIGKKRGLPVSHHNVWCDTECGRQAQRLLALP